MVSAPRAWSAWAVLAVKTELSGGSVVDDGAAHVAAAALALHEGGLALEDGERLLEALDLCLAARLALLVGLRLGDAAVLDLRVVLVHGVELGLGLLAVAGDLRNGLLLGLVLLGLVLHVLLLGGLDDLVLLGDLLVLGRRVGLLLLYLGEAGGEVGLADLEDADDAAAGAAGRGVSLRRGGLLLLHERGRGAAVVLAEDAERLAHAGQAELEVGRGNLVVRVLLAADLVHLGLLLGQLGQLLLELLDLLLELRGLGGGLVDLGRHLRDVVLELLLLGGGLGHLLVAVGLLGRLLLGLRLELGDHVGDEALDLAEDVRVVAAVLGHG